MKKLLLLLSILLFASTITYAQPQPRKKKVAKGYDQIYPFVKGKAKVVKNGKIGYINMEGEEFIPCKYEEIYPFEGGKAKAKRDGKYGFLNEQGEEIIECKFDFIGPFKNGRAVVKLDGRLEIIDTEGAVITEGNHSGS
ncbi:MAG: WG repeat-containing protein [Bacteroidota bacterium]|jgi:hypothetical protein